ncbi:MAG TPA: hypothetical protein VMT64_08960, partial [Candidatus Binataceae bacterium]|nr:hypothetical protein [Candidatus Binataceae bacterium]
MTSSNWLLAFFFSRGICRSNSLATGICGPMLPIAGNSGKISSSPIDAGIRRDRSEQTARIMWLLWIHSMYVQQLPVTREFELLF